MSSGSGGYHPGGNKKMKKTNVAGEIYSIRESGEKKYAGTLGQAKTGGSWERRR